jgi:uncharacterized surface protein with fasciclin (FAS1) repeats
MRRATALFLMLLLPLALFACGEDTPRILDISSVPTLDPIMADTYTSFENLGLPGEVDVTLSDGSQTTVLVAWDTARTVFDASTGTSVTLEGRLILTGLITNSQGLSLDVQVTIERVSLLEAITRQPQFSILEEAIIAAGLETYFETDNTLTLFAPNNQAFTNFFAVYDLDKDAFLALDTLSDILGYHVIERTHSTDAILGFTPVDLISLEGSRMSFTSDEGLLVNSYAHIVDADREATNGILHEIDNVLLPPDVATELSGTFFDESLLDTFAQILTESDIVTALLLSGDISLDGTTELTLFAPSDVAFQTLIESYGITTEDLLAFERIDEVLLNHAVIGSHLADQLYLDAPTSLESIAGNTLSVTVVEGVLMIEDAILESTVDGFPTGQVHVIDKVLLTDELAAALEDYVLTLQSS